MEYENIMQHENFILWMDQGTKYEAFTLQPYWVHNELREEEIDLIVGNSWKAKNSFSPLYDSIYKFVGAM